MGGKITFPLYSIYHATKFAVEGFTESLQYELAQFNILLKLIEPGPIVTNFMEEADSLLDQMTPMYMIISLENLMRLPKR